MWRTVVALHSTQANGTSTMRSIIVGLAYFALPTLAFAHGPSQIQLQGQSQSQYQAQSQSQRLYNANINQNGNYNFNRNTATGGSAHSNSNATGGASSNVIGINNGTNTPWYGYGSGVAIAPSTAVGNGVCASTASFGAGFIGSLSFGFPITDHSCNVRANYTTFKLPVAVQRKLMCEDKYMNAAFTAAGYSDCTNVQVAR